MPTIKRGSVHYPSARLYSFALAVFVALILVALIPHLDDSLGFDMAKTRCCSCRVENNGTCKNCACVKDGKACTDCYPSRGGLCSNPIGKGCLEAKVAKLVCPFVNCAAGVNGKPLERRPQDISRLRTHISSHLVEDFVPSDEWMAEHDSQLCPGYSSAILCRVVVLNAKREFLIRATTCRLHGLDTFRS